MATQLVRNIKQHLETTDRQIKKAEGYVRLLKRDRKKHAHKLTVLIDLKPSDAKANIKVNSKSQRKD